MLYDELCTDVHVLFSTLRALVLICCLINQALNHDIYIEMWCTAVTVCIRWVSASNAFAQSFLTVINLPCSITQSELYANQLIVVRMTHSQQTKPMNPSNYWLARCDNDLQGICYLYCTISMLFRDCPIGLRLRCHYVRMWNIRPPRRVLKGTGRTGHGRSRSSTKQARQSQPFLRVHL